jgi:hypothetical protein
VKFEGVLPWWDPTESRRATAYQIKSHAMFGDKEHENTSM